ncbi:hypothetical protein KN10_2351 [Anoxybacillus flavithermus NBRC 109594]|uniref:Uncharacterized protein n=1 Tax=Anoxybacillus flavithermus NBRC 109594 TaxID=1315967 RepID=R4FGA8_9BACL|nr:hypothetical protein KN10_2351 [Anoxybacillus flavithermus NBRC 109594]
MDPLLPFGWMTLSLYVRSKRGRPGNAEEETVRKSSDLPLFVLLE